MTIASIDDPDLSTVSNLEAVVSGQSGEFPDGTPADFNEDAYIRAFPDVLGAIAQGTYSSPLQHYLEHGRHEGRLTHTDYLRSLSGPAAEGNIDFYGHAPIAGGWIFCGWTSERWDTTSQVGVVAHFQNGDITGAAMSAYYRRDGLRGRGTGLVLFVQAESTPASVLRSVDISVKRTVLNIAATSDAVHTASKDIQAITRALWNGEQESKEGQEFLLLLSTAGYGRLRPKLNVLRGFIDFYGYHAAAGGWFFCGWLTRSWDQDSGPDRLIAHFVGGDMPGQDNIVGFYHRDDVVDLGIGFVLFVRGVNLLMGALTSIELCVDDLPSFVQVPLSSQRYRDTELSGALQPVIGQIAAPEVSDNFLALLRRKPYAGMDTISTLSGPIFLEFDEVIACPPGGLVVMGWFLAKSGTVRALRLRSGVVDEPFDMSDCIKIERPDVITALGAEHGFDDPRCGFITYIPAAIPLGAEVYVEIETTRHDIGFRKLPAPKLEGIPAIKRILGAFDVRYNGVPRAFDKIIGPAVEHLNRRRLAEWPRTDKVEYGKVNPTPRFSVIIPLYGRLDFVESQMAFFSSHAPAADYEFIYVLDDPPRLREAERLFASVYQRFQIPFRVLIMEQNVGFGPANNAGLRIVQGEYVCFMNSDVFPTRPGGLEHLASRLEEHPNIGVVGPLLLYGDGSVQHEGMIFKTLSEFGGWPFGEHPRKGMRKASVTGLRRHICITAACMLMRSSLARALGGFDEAYVIGDFEDSDLCFRLHRMGLDCAVDLDIEMYHLQRKSQGSSGQTWRMNLTLYNAWVHQKRWATTIANSVSAEVPMAGTEYEEP